MFGRKWAKLKILRSHNAAKRFLFFLFSADEKLQKYRK